MFRFVVGFAAWDGFDAYTRLSVRHFGKHVPGNLNTVVENMTGAGSHHAHGNAQCNLKEALAME